MTRVLRIGVSSCMFQPDPARDIFKGKRLLYMEESMFHWIMSEHDVFAFLLPTAPAGDVERLVAAVDGVLLSGGVDVSPQFYGEVPLRPEWSGDPVRDEYEFSLVHTAMGLGKPVLGVCRGQQVINVALGGSLYQDINTMIPGSLVHRDRELYDQNTHLVHIEATSGLHRLYKGCDVRKINSVHHQSVKDLGDGLVVEARSPEDGVVEAIRLKRTTGDVPYVFAVQWHPEFQDPGDASFLPARPILREFLDEAKRRSSGV